MARVYVCACIEERVQGSVRPRVYIPRLVQLVCGTMRVLLPAVVTVLDGSQLVLDH